jgi:hypothetical protein
VIPVFVYLDQFWYLQLPTTMNPFGTPHEQYEERKVLIRTRLNDPLPPVLVNIILGYEEQIPSLSAQDIQLIKDNPLSSPRKLHFPSTAALDQFLSELVQCTDTYIQRAVDLGFIEDELPHCNTWWTAREACLFERRARKLPEYLPPDAVGITYECEGGWLYRRITIQGTTFLVTDDQPHGTTFQDYGAPEFDLGFCTEPGDGNFARMWGYKPKAENYCELLQQIGIFGNPDPNLYFALRTVAADYKSSRNLHIVWATGDLQCCSDHLPPWVKTYSDSLWTLKPDGSYHHQYTTEDQCTVCKQFIPDIVASTVWFAFRCQAATNYHQLHHEMYYKVCENKQCHEQLQKDQKHPVYYHPTFTAPTRKELSALVLHDYRSATAAREAKRRTEAAAEASRYIDHSMDLETASQDHIVRQGVARLTENGFIERWNKGPSTLSDREQKFLEGEKQMMERTRDRYNRSWKFAGTQLASPAEVIEFNANEMKDRPVAFQSVNPNLQGSQLLMGFKCKSCGSKKETSPIRCSSCEEDQYCSVACFRKNEAIHLADCFVYQIQQHWKNKNPEKKSVAVVICKNCSKPVTDKAITCQKCKNGPIYCSKRCRNADRKQHGKLCGYASKFVK